MLHEAPWGRTGGIAPPIKLGNPLRALIGMNMPFHFGQVFETDDGRQAIVLHIRNGGREALLRYVVEEWLTWDDFQKDGKWRWASSER